MSSVYFTYAKGGRVKEMSERDAKILEKLKLGSYLTRDMVAGRAMYPPPQKAEPVVMEPVSEVTQDTPELDDHGTAWNPEIHAESKVKNKDGSWRKKPGGKQNSEE